MACGSRNAEWKAKGTLGQWSRHRCYAAPWGSLEMQKSLTPRCRTPSVSEVVGPCTLALKTCRCAPCSWLSPHGGVAQNGAFIFPSR